MDSRMSRTVPELSAHAAICDSSQRYDLKNYSSPSLIILLACVKIQIL